MHHTDPDAEWPSAKQAARMLGVSVATVYKLVKAGALATAPRDRGMPYQVNPASIAALRRERRTP